MAPEGAPNVSARGAENVNTRDEVAQRDISDADLISGSRARLKLKGSREGIFLRKHIFLLTMSVVDVEMRGSAKRPI